MEVCTNLSPWDQARMNWLVAKQAADRFHRRTYTKASLRNPHIPQQIGAEMVNLDDVAAERQNTMLITPAPNRAALRQKLELLFELMEDFIPGDDVMAAIRSDSRRLL